MQQGGISVTGITHWGAHATQIKAGAGPPLEPEAAPPLRFLQGWEFVTKEIGVSSQLSAPPSP
jgi:hypothetical protein